ncbi:MAG: flagellin, partial [Campylobacterota bacterium]|nr:flagellin [Campylobacterota bacterium]
MKINTNVTSLAILDSLTQTSLLQEQSYKKLDSGLRITRAADDVSGVSIADKLRTQASSMVQGLENGTNATALIQIADKAMSEQSNILDSVKTRLIDASTGTTNNDGREIIRKDIVKLLEQFDKLASQTNYAGTTLLQKSAIDNSKADKLEFQASVGSKFFIE